MCVRIISEPPESQRTLNMRLATLLTPAGPRSFARIEDYYVELNSTDPTLPSSVRELLAGGADLSARSAIAAKSSNAVRIPLTEAKFGPVVPDAQKILCIGLNYRDHAIEGGKAIPVEPVLFAKYHNALNGHDCAIRLPKVSQKVDYEAELVVVIGRRGRDVAEADAMSYVAGYTCGHDVSARDWQMRGAERQWTIGKTFDSFAPIGPELVTADELPDPHNLRVQMHLNGETMQDSNTREFIFSVPQLIAYLTQIVTLEPGDLIFTGTPPGVGFARRPPVWLRPGDVCEVEIEGIGILRNPVIAA
jgi:2-keto-4-pentenoate hydratase/2-oxohepta-3-ene-1,7-dioic acid hydratase in catechol pathway